MARRRRHSPERKLRSLIWGILVLAVILVALTRSIGDRFLGWGWPIFLFLPLIFWILVGLLYVKRLLEWRRRQRLLNSQAEAPVIERACAGTWGAAQFRPLLAVAVAPEYLHIAIPSYVLMDVESLLIPFKEVRVIEVRRQRLAASFRIVFYNYGGHLEEFTLYPRRPQRLQAALEQSQAPLKLIDPLPSRALVYSVLDLAWALLLVLWLVF